MAGQGVTLYAAAAGGNKVAFASGIDWREDTFLPNQINDNVAQIMADLRALVNSVGLGFVEVGDGDGVYTATYVSATQFFIAGADVTAYYRVGMRVRVVAPTPGTLTGTITVSAFSTHTYVTVAWDSGSLANEAITAILVGIGSGPGGGSGVIQPVRHDCRFDYINGSTCRLNRYGGNQITIDAQLRTIPAGGVDLAYAAIGTPAAGTAMYIYAKWDGANVILAPNGNGPILDPRNGNHVLNGDVTATLVGMIVGGYGSFIQDTTRLGVLSFWNRRGFNLVAAVGGVTTPSTTPIIVSALATNALTWADETTRLCFTGYAANSGNVAYCATDLYYDGNSCGCSVIAHSHGAGYLTNQTTHGEFIFSETWHSFAPYVWVSANGGTWYGRFHVATRG